MKKFIAREIENAGTYTPKQGASLILPPVAIWASGAFVALTGNKENQLVVGISVFFVGLVFALPFFAVLVGWLLRPKRAHH